MGIVWLVCDERMVRVEDGTRYRAALADALAHRPLTALFITAGSEFCQTLAEQTGLPPSIIPSPDTTPAALVVACMRIIVAQQEAEVAMFVPAEVLRAVLCRAFEIPEERATSIAQDPGAISRLIVEPHRLVVAGINDRCHLPA